LASDRRPSLGNFRVVCDSVHLRAFSLSGFYAINGVVLLYISFDLEYYRSLLKLLVAIFIVMGFTLTILDLSLGMPFSWTLSEGPVEILFGGLMWWLMKKTDPEDVKKQ